MPSAHINAINLLLNLAGSHAEGHKAGAPTSMMVSVDCPTGDIYAELVKYPGCSVVLHPDGSAKYTTPALAQQRPDESPWIGVGAD